ncbi:GIY-YIG nuclease family protein [Elizabethkingia anophelis]|uniref:GIY-YIG nuclease family protein n=1 Tax=Elizabethkingia anophelis TaxID=1117645 RepID=UPI0009CFD1B8|nr:GIY-YIG nuclease family protein [Elizabethkingia anophelis]MCT3690980.1 GIY-YIG nuclease family protein [Elizabethkingia anophelis]MCT3822446.1 GIY-YIG nuclease family protein [Elizabethkingia anophelis]MCT3928789.1 GIY-YIG nuclease family protein [Elizabethkingia anophelis]MCT4075923.1 GIY-YIG nuclease family protein [Elizabethkingia anophelis]MCT4078558.1 GIY-YIG nuclease family protein [Elizabethkingia anophelis]
MSTFGKTIRLFLVDGTANGLTTAELSNWTGIGVKVPRIKIREYSNRPEFQKPGVYILIGKGENNEDAAYIGEAEIIANRLFQQIADKDFWNEVIFFGSKDKYLNKASVKYLENRLHALALNAGRYTINQNTPTRSELSEAEQAELEEFLSHAKVLTATLGHKLFEALEETVEDNEVQNQIFYCRNGAGAESKGSPSTEGFIVYKDSLFIITEQPSLADGIRLERQKMLNDGTLKIESDFYKLTKDYVFTSPSRAAAATLARSASGPLEWKTAEGIQLKTFEV